MQTIFKPLGPAPIQEPFHGKLNLANPLGSGIAAGAINSLAMKQDSITKSGWLYAGSVNGGVWGSKYNGTTDTWESWQFLSNTSSYKGAQSIGKLQITENQKWLIAGKGNPSNYISVSGNIGYPLQVAEIQADGTLKWLEFSPATQTSIFDAKITAIETMGELLIIGTHKEGLHISSLDATGQLQTVSAANLGETAAIAAEFDIRSIAKGSAGRIYAAVLNKGIYYITDEELNADKNARWNLLNSDDLCNDKTNLRLATSKDPATGEDIIFLGTSAEYTSNGKEKNRIDTISQAKFDNINSNVNWKTEQVGGLIGSDQANLGTYGNFSFASDPSNHNRILAGGNQYSDFTGHYTGGLVAVTFAETAKLERLFSQFIASNSAPHADSRDIKFINTISGLKIIESDDGGVYQIQNDLKSPWQGINHGLNTAESYASDWSNIGNLAITAMQDNAVSIGSYSGKPTWLNVYGGDGSIARFDDGIIGGDGNSRGYYSSQMYFEGKGLSCSTYDNTGILEKIEFISLNIIDEYKNIHDFQNYDYQWAIDKEIEYPFYQPVETNAYRAGDYVMAGMRNIYEQISPHWLGSPGEMNLKPLLDDTEEQRTFTALSVGSNNPTKLSTSTSWDALFTSYIDKEGKTHLYGRQLSNTEAKLTKLSLPNGVTAPEGRNNIITGISVNPLDTNQIYATISKWSLFYGVSFENDGDDALIRENPKNEDDFEAASYLAYSLDAGSAWQEIKAGDNGIPKTANLQHVAFAPANAYNINNQIYVGGYGGVWVASLDSNGNPGIFTNVSFQGQAENAPLEIWNTNLKYDPVDDVLIASTIGQGAWLLSRSNFETEPIIEKTTGLRIVDSIMPQDVDNFRNRKNRPAREVLAITLDRNNLNQDKDVSVDLRLGKDWEKYIKFDYISTDDINQNTYCLNFPKGVDNLYLDYEALNPKANIPDKSITLSLVNPVNADIAKNTAEIYLYATADTINFYQEGNGVFYAQSEVAQQLSVLLPRASLDKDDTLYWYKVDDNNGDLGNVSPGDAFYLDFLKGSNNPTLIEIAKTTFSKDSRAFNPDQAYWAYKKPELALQSEGIQIGEVTNLDLGVVFKEKKLEQDQLFALAIKDKSGNIKATPMGYKINSNMDNAISFNPNGTGPEVVLAPGNGDLFIVSADQFNGAEEFDRITMNIDITRVGSYTSGYGLFRVDDLNGNFWLENDNFTKEAIKPGSIKYAKEALRRSLNHQSSPLDGVTGLPIPDYGSSIRHSVDLATGNAYGVYITPNQTLNSTDQLTNLSQILFSIQGANQDELPHQVSMGTGYFAFEDMGLVGDRDFNDMLFSITPKTKAIL